MKAAFAQTKPEDVGGAQYRELERQIFSTTNQLGSYEEQMRVVQNTVLGIGEIISGTKEEFQNFEDQTKKTGEGILATITAIKEGMDEWNMAEGVTQVISSFMQIATVKKILNETTEELLKVRQEMSAMMLMDP